MIPPSCLALPASGFMPADDYGNICRIYDDTLLSHDQTLFD